MGLKKVENNPCNLLRICYVRTMKNEIKNVLDIPQNSDASNFMHGMEWTCRSYNHFDKPTFAEIAAKFPELVKPEDTRLRWGHGHYCEDDSGMPKCFREDFDTSG